MTPTRPLVVLFAAIAIASGCGEDESGPREPTAVSGDPISCLEAAGLSDVEARSSDFWRGYHETPFYQVSVQLLSSTADARELVKRRDGHVYAAQGGKYVVTGPLRQSAGGLVTANQGLEAGRLVREVASCLSD